MSADAARALVGAVAGVPAPGTDPVARVAHASVHESTRIAELLSVRMLFKQFGDHGVGFLEATLRVLAQQVQFLVDVRSFKHEIAQHMRICGHHGASPTLVLMH